MQICAQKLTIPTTSLWPFRTACISSPLCCTILVRRQHLLAKLKRLTASEAAAFMMASELSSLPAASPSHIRHTSMRSTMVVGATRWKFSTCESQESWLKSSPTKIWPASTPMSSSCSHSRVHLYHAGSVIRRPVGFALLSIHFTRASKSQSPVYNRNDFTASLPCTRTVMSHFANFTEPSQFLSPHCRFAPLPPSLHMAAAILRITVACLIRKAKIPIW